MQIIWMLASCDTYSTYLMEQSPSWEANRFSSGQEITGILLNPKVHCRIYKYSQSVHIMSQTNAVHAPVQIPEDLSYYYPSVLAWIFHVVSFSSGFTTKILYRLFISPYVLHAPYIYIFPSLITRIIFGEVTDHYVLHYVVFSTPLLPRPPSFKYSPQHPIIKGPQPTFLPQFERPSSRPIQKNRQNFNYVCLFLYFWIINFAGLNRQRLFPYMTFTIKYPGILAFKVKLVSPEMHNQMLN
jgi:hypothetical protein